MADILLVVYAIVATRSVMTLLVSVVYIGWLKKGVMLMAKRFELSTGVSQSMFTRNALRVHPYNSNVMTGPGGPMRGGIRL